MPRHGQQRVRHRRCPACQLVRALRDLLPAAASVTWRWGFSATATFARTRSRSRGHRPCCRASVLVRLRDGKAESAARIQARPHRLGDDSLPRHLPEPFARDYRARTLTATDRFLAATERAREGLLLRESNQIGSRSAPRGSTSSPRCSVRSASDGTRRHLAGAAGLGEGPPGRDAGARGHQARAGSCSRGRSAATPDRGV